MLVIVRLGSQLPTPGVDPTFIKEFFAQQTGDAFNFFEAFTGGSFTNFSIFALSITPYITSSIIMQLLTIAIPKLEEMQKEGEEGRKKIAAITRYVTVALALIESTAMAVGFGRQGLLEEYNFVSCAVVVCTLTAGSAFMMWIGERITENGVGNGISIVLLINIISRVPSDLYTLYEKFMSGKKLAQAGLAGLVILAVILAVVVFVVLLQSGERRIAVQYSKKVQGRKTYGGQTTLGTWIADWLVAWIETFQGWVGGLMENANPLLSILVDGIIGGVGAVVGFLPLVMVMYFLIACIGRLWYSIRTKEPCINSFVVTSLRGVFEPSMKICPSWISTVSPGSPMMRLIKSCFSSSGYRKIMISNRFGSPNI